MPHHHWRTPTPRVAPSPVGELQHGQGRGSFAGVPSILPKALPEGSRLCTHALVPAASFVQVIRALPDDGKAAHTCAGSSIISGQRRTL